jgi:hypothetical protein
MEAALKVAADVPVSIDRETASTWTERMLAESNRASQRLSTTRSSAST